MTSLWNLTLLIILLMNSLPLYAHREHKVHNIVLYPDKQSWCKTTQIKQVVTWPQCSSQELDNNVCVGACFSYMVPHSEPSAPGDLIRPYCDSCQPLDSVWHTVTLDCKDEDNKPITMQKKVQIITNCSCSSCLETSKIKPDYNTLLQTLSDDNLDNVNIIHETPDLLLNPNLNSSKNTSRDIQANEKFRQLFKQLKESAKIDEFKAKELFSKFEDEEFDMEKLQELLRKYANLGGGNVNDDKLKENKQQIIHNNNGDIKEEIDTNQSNQPQLPTVDDDDNNDDDDVELPQIPHHNAPITHMHRGPHHSLVLEPDVKEKIDVEPHYLHPAVAGQEISYHDNVLVDKAKKKEF
ncbi:uncharacterized protein LOC127284222 [Leptopilina boulardi]|uniref:uncharacterized protein LOC127284222 n=1 Tax=Leptopilina boulardi TaxID=63433 RepID=UPI0021F565EA|nr:uncharacterized protein LOC127284222 [Leptopilina boulardi]